MKVDQGRLYGRGIAFPPRVGLDGRVAWSEGPANIRESICVILKTELGERLMLPAFGGGLGRFLFEPNTVATRHQIEERVTRTLAQWEPRITVQAVSVDADPDDAQSAVATVTYKLVASGARERVTLGIALQR